MTSLLKSAFDGAAIVGWWFRFFIFCPSFVFGAMSCTSEDATPYEGDPCCALWSLGVTWPVRHCGALG